jgi:phenylacetate-CoA ligase
VHDVYGCEEVGYLALQCPRHDHYHVQSESVLVEILDDEGRPVPPGEMGWVVVTPLVNFAMPLLRYRIGDLAEVGPPCPCGRGLPVLARVPGRRRGQVLRPDGTRAFPDTGALWDAIEDVDQIQVVQTGPLAVEVRYSGGRAVAPGEEPAIVARVQAALGYAFPITLRRLPVLRRQANGKYETFTCLCPR